MIRYNSYNTALMKDNPCRKDCPDRYPGCNCERRKAWRDGYEAKKRHMYQQKNDSSMIDNVIATGKNRRKK